MKARVLIADDHTLFLEGMKKLLEPSCWIIGTATNGQALIAEAEKQRPEVILTDINMPQLNGLEACERLLKKLPGTRIILAAGQDDVAGAEEAIRRGAFGYVLKTPATPELDQAIPTVRGGRRYVTSAIASEGIQVFVG